MTTYTVEVRAIVEVELDDSEFTPEFMEEFNSTITDFGKGPEALKRHAEHLAWVHATGAEDLAYVRSAPFVEGR